MNIVKKQELVNLLIEVTEEVTRYKVALESDLEIKQVKIKNKLLNE
jgi:hypothetical protein